MRGELRIESMPKEMVNNKILVGVDDTFAGFTSKGGIQLVNLTVDDTWGDSDQYNISEFVMRHGKVLKVPQIISRGSFNYDTECELREGDTVFWNLAGFSDHLPLVLDKKLILMVDYHEILARKRGDDITPINGNGLFSSVEVITAFFKYQFKTKVSDSWILEVLPEKNVKHVKDNRGVADCWAVGDKVRLLVRSSPYKLEGNINTTLDKELYACPMNYIICTC
jgi:hypothetical protein